MRPGDDDCASGENREETTVKTATATGTVQTKQSIATQKPSSATTNQIKPTEKATTKVIDSSGAQSTVKTVSATTGKFRSK